MKTKTINGTVVEIRGISGNNLVMVAVQGRQGLAQPDACDLICPAGTLPVELAGLHFFDPNAPKVVKPPAEPSEPDEG